VDRTLQWAKKTLRDIKRAARRISRLYEFHLDENDEVYTARRAGNKKKKRPNFKAQVLKYGVEVPRNIKAGKRLDEINGNTFWQDAIDKEIGALKDLECFDFHPSNYKVKEDYQWCTLTMIFDVKQYLRRKARLVAGGHLVDCVENNIYSSTVKGISIRMLHVIAHQILGMLTSMHTPATS
jgi:hypothetical protein